MPAKPPPTIKTRFLPGTAFVTGGFSSGNDLVRTVVMETLHDLWGGSLSGMDMATATGNLERRCGA
jgi:hypothetical protein